MRKIRLLPLFLCFSIFFSGCARRSEQENTLPVHDAMSRPNILNNAVPVDADGILNYIPNDLIEEQSMQELRFFQDQLLLSYFVYDENTDMDILHLRLLSLDSGELLRETQLSVNGSYTVVVQVCEDRIAVTDAQSGQIHVFDETLKEIKTYEACGDLIYVNPSITTAYCLTTADGVHILDLSTKEERVVLENARDLSFCAYSENNITIRYIDLSDPQKKEYYAGFDLETGDFEKLSADVSLFEASYYSGIWAGKCLSEDNVFLTGTRQTLSRFRRDLNNPAVCLAGYSAHLILTSTGSDGIESMECYDTDGHFLSACSFSDVHGILTSTQLCFDETLGCFFLVMDESGYDHLYFWDFGEKTTGNDLELRSLNEKEDSGGTALYASFYDRAATLSEKYGMTIKIADQCDTDFGEKTAVPECDPQTVQNGLDVLEKAISSYPEGFFDQLYYGTYRTIEINLMGAITNKEFIEAYTPNAFVQHENGKIIMVLNIDDSADSLLKTFYHETSHIIDKVLEHDALYREDALYSEEKWWSQNPSEFIELNPEAGGYYESYEIMPMSYYQEVFTPYFASDYAKSFATEDRATVFELAMTGSSQLSSFGSANPLRQKLEYYCQCIRDCFDTTNWSDTTIWETSLS